MRAIAAYQASRVLRVQEGRIWFELTSYNSELILVLAPDQQVSKPGHD
jgi:hypothetical protein